MIQTIFPTAHFRRSYKGLPEEIKKQASAKEKLFKSSPYDPRLKTHKLKGKLANYWSYSVNYQYRILFRFAGEFSAIYFDIGTHDIYR